MLPPGIKNPFLTHKLDDTASLPAGDVPELHATVLSKCGDMFAQARYSRQAIGLLVVGEAGSGKSHLVAQLRQQFAAIPTAVHVSISLKGAYAGRLWRHLRERLVTELLREYKSADHGANGLLRILRNRFPKWAAATQSGPGGLLGWLLGKAPSKNDLQPFLSEAAKSGGLNYGLQKVLPKVSSPDLTLLAHDWLRGQQLGSDDLVKLGLPPSYPSEQEQEVTAREVVLSLLQLAGEQTVLMLCFDEVEAIQSSNWDAAVLRQFTTLVTDLLGDKGARVVATFIRPNLKLELDKAVEVSNIQKMSQFTATIPPLSWEQMVRVVVCRLDAEQSCRPLRALHAPDIYWPLGQKFLDGVFQENRRVMTPRHAIRACAVEFLRQQNGEPSGPGGPPVDGGGEQSGDEFLRLWEKLRKKLLKSPQSIKFDSVMGIVLPWLVELTGRLLTSAHGTGSQHAEFSLLFQPLHSTKPVGVCFCSQDPRSLWRKQDKLIKLWSEMKGKSLGMIVTLRAADPAPAKGAMERFDTLRAADARVLLIPAAQLADVAALQAMFTAAASGELTRAGKPVEKVEFSQWAKDNLSADVKLFMSQMFDAVPMESVPPALSLAKPTKNPTTTKAKK